jgi:hypothetical protein
MDGRRKQWFPLASEVAFTRTGTKLLARWGMEGLCTWMLYLAACKRDLNPGSFRYTSEPEGWTKLGARATSFTLEDFFKYTGTLKQTKRTRIGRVSHVVCTNWEAWDYETRRQIEREEKSRKRAGNTRTEDGHSTDSYGTKLSSRAQTETETETDSDYGRGSPRTDAYFGPPPAIEKQREIDKLLTLAGNVEANSRSVVAKEALVLPLGSLAKVRESVERKRDAGDPVGVGYIVNALRKELEEVAA